MTAVESNSEALELCRRAAEGNPGDAETWHKLGLVESALGQMAQARNHFEQAVALQPRAAVYRSNLALACGLEGDWERAVGEYRQAVELRPAHANSLAKLGRALARTGSLDEAAGWLERAVALDPGADHLNALAAALAQAGHLEEAARRFQQALEIAPNHEEAGGNLAHVVQLALQRGAERASALDWRGAAANFDLAARIEPANAEAHFNLALARVALNELRAAARGYERATQLKPDYAEAWNNWAHVALALGDPEKALELARRATTERDDYTDAHYNMGVMLQELDRPEEAEQCYRRVIELDASRVDALNNLGSLALGRNQWREAITRFDEAIGLEAETIDARWNRALALLTLGCWREGWQAYEVRLKREEYRSRTFEARRWEGEDLAGCSVLVWCEQGLGDTIQFLRLVRLVEARGGDVWVECQPRLKPLLEAAGMKVIAKGEPLPWTEFEVPLMSLPRLLGLEPDTVPPPYSGTNISAARAGEWSERVHDWRQRLGGMGFKVGLVWGAQLANFAGRSRSMPLAALEPLSRIPGVRMISLQHGPQAGEAQACYWVERFEEPHGDVLDTAALMANLDLVITVDTMTAHLAGTLGIPVWTLLPFAADWRWMQTAEPASGEPTVWYESMRLWRQKRRGDWEGVVTEVTEELGARAASSS